MDFGRSGFWATESVTRQQHHNRQMEGERLTVKGPERFVWKDNAFPLIHRAATTFSRAAEWSEATRGAGAAAIKVPALAARR
jgi:hypothetical protein